MASVVPTKHGRGAHARKESLQVAGTIESDSMTTGGATGAAPPVAS